MSTSVLVIPPTSSKFPDASAARKRRREILASQRQALELTTTSSSRTSNYDQVFTKKPRRVSDLSEPESQFKSIASACANTMIASMKSTNTKKKIPAKKKPQMKYDPDVPMSKEDAAAWRREQRRKRNRESAALSRQRQRDRIGDLEVEVEQWKAKVENIMERIKNLEDATGIDSRSLITTSPRQENLGQSLEFEVVGTSDSNNSKFVSPPPSPSPRHTPLYDDAKASPITSSCAKTVVDAVVDQVLMGIESYEQEFSDKMISRHAVKITTDTPALPFLPKSEVSVAMMPTPEACLSGVVTTQNVQSGANETIKINNPRSSAPTTTLDPIDSSLFPVKDEEKIPTILSDDENEDEFGEFLLDAVQWL